MHWSDITDIAKNLENEYSEYYKDDMNLSDLEELVKDLNDFEDYEIEVKRTTLQEIYEKWKEIREGELDEEEE